MRHSKKLATLLGVGMSLSLAACGNGGKGDTGAQGQPVVRIQTYPGAFANIVQWVAADQGFCKANGIVCKTQDIASGPLGLQALVSGDLQVSFASTDVTMQAAAKGAPVEIVAATEPNNLYSFVVANDVKFPAYPQGMKSLKDATVGVTARGAATEIQSRALFEGAGLDPAAPQYIPVGSPNTGYPALAGGKVKSAMVFEPFQTLCQVLKKCKVAVDLRDPSQGPPLLRKLNGAFETFAVTKRFAQQNPKTVDSFIKSIQQAVTWIQKPQHFDKALAIVKKHFSLGAVPNSDTIVRNMLKKQIPRFGATIDRSAVEGFSTFLMHYKIISHPVSTQSFVYQNAPKP